jgi:hypothetical protein
LQEKKNEFLDRLRAFCFRFEIMHLRSAGPAETAAVDPVARPPTKQAKKKRKESGVSKAETFYEGLYKKASDENERLRTQNGKLHKLVANQDRELVHARKSGQHYLASFLKGKNYNYELKRQLHWQQMEVNRWITRYQTQEEMYAVQAKRAGEEADEYSRALHDLTGGLADEVVDMHRARALYYVMDATDKDMIRRHVRDAHERFVQDGWTAGPPSNPWKDLQEDTDLENINSRACESVYASDDEDTAPN